jgi:two-component sensor histidine kinase
MTDYPYDSHPENYPTGMTQGDNALLHETIALREAHHRVRNQLHYLLNTVYQNSRSATEPGEQAAWAACLSQLTAMVRLHDVLENEPPNASVDLADFLSPICRLYRDAFALAERVSVDLDAESIVVSSSLAETIALIVIEALTNSVKHGFPDGRSGWIRVALKRGGNRRVTLLVSDNGIGPKGDIFAGRGLHIIEGLTTQAGGHVE